MKNKHSQLIDEIIKKSSVDFIEEQQIYILVEEILSICDKKPCYDILISLIYVLSKMLAEFLKEDIPLDQTIEEITQLMKIQIKSRYSLKENENAV